MLCQRSLDQSSGMSTSYTSGSRAVWRVRCYPDWGCPIPGIYLGESMCGCGVPSDGCLLRVHGGLIRVWFLVKVVVVRGKSIELWVKSLGTPRLPTLAGCPGRRSTWAPLPSIPAPPLPLFQDCTSDFGAVSEWYERFREFWVGPHH